MQAVNNKPARSLTHGVGLSFKADFYEDVVASSDAERWFEVHTENYCAIGGPRKRMLTTIAERFPISLHGVGGSLGNEGGDVTAHLANVSQLVKQVKPAFVSEHVAWSQTEHEYLADLLPVKRTSEALTTLVNNIDRYQNAIGRSILIENPTHYIALSHEIAEPEFLLEVAERSGCGLLIDVTNLFLSEANCGVKAAQFIKKIPGDYVGEIHVAGYEQDQLLQGRLIDSHSQPVPTSVKRLLALAYQTWGIKPTLLERDANLPTFSELCREADLLRDIMRESSHAIA